MLGPRDGRIRRIDWRRVAVADFAVAVQVAFLLVLLIAAGIFVCTLSELRPSGYRGRLDKVLLFMRKRQQEIHTPERKRLLGAELIRRVQN